MRKWVQRAAFAVSGLVAGATVGLVFNIGGADSAPVQDKPAVVGEVLTVQVWEDGSGEVLSGTVDIGGEPWDLSGMTFCLYGQGCTDTEVPHVVAVPSLEGHAPCWGVKLSTTVAWCADGHTIGF